MANQFRAFFVDTTYILENYAGYLDSNIDANSITTFIQVAQNEKLTSLLGQTLFNYYVTIIKNNMINDASNVNYKYLLDNFIVDSVSLWAIYFALDTIHLRITNKSIVTKHSEWSTAVSTADLKRIKTQVSERAEFIDAQTKRYILNNPGFFQQYFQVTQAQQIVPKNNPYFNGIYLPDYRGYADSANGNIWGMNRYKPGIGWSLWNT